MMNGNNSTDATPLNVPRSVWAVLVGWIAVVSLSLATDHVLQQAKVLPGWGQPVYDSRLNLLALTYRCAFSVLGSYLAGRLAPRHPMRHAMILGVIGFLLSLLGAMIAIQNHFGPAWYPLALAATALPCAWLGGFLAQSSRA